MNNDELRFYHGNISPNDFARMLVADFNYGNMVAQQLGSGENIIVQIRSKDQARSGGRTALSVAIRKVEDGVSVQLGNQSWLGVAASLGKTFLWAWRNPWSIINRLDDLAQDFEYVQLADQIWESIENTAYSSGASFELSDRLKRLECEYCHTANPIGESNCISCGAPLGQLQPKTCLNCGFVFEGDEIKCKNCGEKL